jgi:release factor glutamine methyltransferase
VPPAIPIADALATGIRLLEEANILAPRLTAQVLLSHALNKERIYLFTHPEELLTELAWIHYGRYLHQRLQGKPTQYITHHQEFYGRDFKVSPAVLIPRPETEHLIERVLALNPSGRIADIGCGSGAIGITLALELQRPVLLTDISAEALAVATTNAKTLSADAWFLQGDLTHALAAHSLDLLVSNPPYIPLTDAPALQREVRDHEPHLALFGGESGHEIYARLIAEAERVLKPSGWLVLELGYSSEPAVRALLSGWRTVQVEPDLAGIPRVLSARR